MMRGPQTGQRQPTMCPKHPLAARGDSRRRAAAACATFHKFEQLIHNDADLVKSLTKVTYRAIYF